MFAVLFCLVLIREEVVEEKSYLFLSFEDNEGHSE